MRTVFYGSTIKYENLPKIVEFIGFPPKRKRSQIVALI